MNDCYDPARRRFLLAAAVCGAIATFAGPAGAKDEPEEEIDALLRRMSIDEKAGQLNMEAVLSPRQGESDFAKLNPFQPPVSIEKGRANHAAQMARIRAGGIGMLSTPMDLDSLLIAQRTAVEESRLRIPIIVGADIIHGFRTVFPVPLAEAASFEPELARRTARACAIEGTAAGHDMTYAPMVDIGRDQRWGRVVEGAGEDVLLGCLFATARVQGFQGARRGTADSLLACVKHFAAYGAAESGLDYAGNALSERVLHEIYLPPFAAAFRAGAILTMASFNTIDGVPSTGNHHLLTDILRNQLGFQGAVISDFESEKELITHGFAADERDAARLALSAGCDVGMVSGLFPRYVPELVRSGALDETIVNRAVRRVLYVKREAGLFEDPYRRMNRKRFQARVPDSHRSLAHEAAVKAVVLLKNEGNLLPLPKAGRRIALIGPFADDTVNLNGPWAPLNPSGRSIAFAEGLRNALSDPALLSVTAGSDVDQPIEGGIDAAVAAARVADVVILAIGESTDMSGESASRADIEVPAPQMRLAEAVAATGKPLVVVLRNGRALALQGAVRDAQAILVGWFLGAQTGAALADILLGTVSPSARLPVTFPLASGQEPYYYARESSGRPPPAGGTPRFTAHFLGLPNAPLYPFGHGLTYSSIQYGITSCAPSQIQRGNSATVSAEIHNQGTRPVHEVVQCYIHDVAASVVQPVRRLVAFEKILLQPGERRTVAFQLHTEQLAFLDRDSKVITEAGDFDVWVAPSALGGTSARLTLS